MATKTTEQFIKDARKVHGDKYDYSRVNYVNSRTKVTIICPKHGEFEQIANNHLRGNGCPKCYEERKGKSKTKTTKLFILEAKKIHQNKYRYSKTIYVRANQKVIITCPKHGDFELAPANHLLGQGCPKCGMILRIKSNSNDTAYFIKRAKEVHGDRYDYSKVKYVNNKTKVIIICHNADESGEEHGEFLLSPHDHVDGKCGCPKCRNKGLRKLYDKLHLKFSNENILYEVTNKTVPWLDSQRFDIYFPKYNIAIEYHGKQHYVPVEHFGGLLGYEDTIERDKLKREKCNRNNCILIEIKYNYSLKEFDLLVDNINNIINRYKL